MKKIVWVLLVMFLLPAQAFAYEFAVKVINKTGSDVRFSSKIWIYPKGGLKLLCRNDGSPLLAPKVKNNESYQWVGCGAGAQKWRRAIGVGFDCDAGTNYREIRFPKGNAKFYARNYATKRGDRYTITIKANDC